MATRNNFINDALAQAQFAEKKWVWVRDKAEGYVAAWITEEKGELVVVEFQDGNKLKLNVNDTEKMNPPKFDKVEDMASLTYLNEASVIHNLRLRYYANSIYTYSGLFLVAVNPYKKLPIYNEETVKAYKSTKRNEVAPHIFAVADAAYHEMIRDKESQSILITGESGAGKTENTKKVIQYLAAIAPSGSGSGKLGSLEQQILQANPILESFGNAQTIRNNNSSRFGKFIRLEFNPSGQICSANIERYLLEKSRVTHQSPKERSYHIFYQLMKGADSELTKKLLLDGILNDYTFVKDSRKDVEGVDDAADFRALVNSMNIMHISPDEQNSFFRIISAILHLGNIQVINDRDDQAQMTEHGQIVVEKVCHILGVSVPEFSKSLLRPKIKAGKDWVTQARDVNQVLYSIEALARALYERMFGKLVDRINNAISNNKDKASFIGVLDIAGFEIFEHNSFEQLCINYTNEKLQQYFNHHMFIIEQEEYRRENIEWKFIDFGLDLQPTIDLIEKSPPIGILSCIDEECVMPRATDKTFLDKLNSLWKSKSPKYEVPRFNSGFILHHYAGRVEYDTSGWLDKNKDPLNENLTRLLATASDSFVASLFVDSLSEIDGLNLPKLSATAGIIKKGAFRTVGQKHKEQLLSLMAQLHSTEPHFVRCIIPNEEKKPGKMNVNLVLEQLRCNGVLEGIRICRAGFPNRLTFSDFRQRYELLSPGVIPQGFMDGKSGAQLLLESLALDRNQYRIGNSKVFFKNGVLADLEERRDEKLETIVTKIQAIVRGHIARRRYKNRLDRCRAIRIIQKNARIYVTLREWSWWKLYTKVRPLLTVTRTDLEIKKHEEATREWEQKAKKESDERAKVEALKAALEIEKRNIERDLVQEKSAAANLQEILERTQKREIILSDQLAVCAQDLEAKECELETILKSKKSLESELRTMSNLLKDQKDHCERIDKDRSLKEDIINELEFKIKLEQERCDKLDSDKRLIEREVKEIQSNLENVTDQAAELLLYQNKLKLSVSDLEQRLEFEQDERKKLDSKKLALESEIQQINAVYSSVMKAKAEIENSLKRKETENITLGEKLEQEIAEREASERQRRDLQSKLSEKQTDLEIQIAERDQLRKTKAKLESELESMTQLVEEKGTEEHKQGELRKLREAEVSDLRNQLSLAQSETEILRKASGIAQDKLNVELDTVRGELLTMARLKANFEKQAKDLAVELELSLESTSKLDKVKRSLESELIASKSHNEELCGALSEFKLAKDTLESKNSQVLSRLDESESNILKIERERQSLSRQLENLREELEDEKNRTSSLGTLNKKLGTELTDLRVRLDESDIQLEDGHRRLAQKSQELDAYRERYNHDVIAKSVEAEDLKRKLDAHILDLESRVNDLDRNTQNLEKSKARLNAETEDLKVELDRQYNASRTLERFLKASESQLAAANIALEVEKREKELLESSIRKLQTSTSTLTLELEEKSLQLLSFQKSKADLENELKTLVNEIGDSGKNLHELDKAKRRLESQVTDLESQLEEEQINHKRSADTKGFLESQLSELKKKLESDIRAKDAQLDELRRLLMKEINSLGDQLEESNQQKSDLIKQKKKLEDHLEELSSRAENNAKGHSDLEKYKKRADQQIKELQSRLEEEERKSKNAEELSERLEKKSNTLQSEVEGLELQVDSLERTRKNLEKKVADLIDEVSGPADDSKTNLLESRKKLERENKILHQKLLDELESRAIFESEKAALSNEIESLKGKARDTDIDKIDRLEESKRALIAAQRLTVQDLEEKTRDNESLEKQKKILQAEVADLRAAIENEIAAKLEESAARRKLTVEIKDLHAKLEAESVKSSDITDVILSYKSRIDGLTVQLESSELSKVKVEKTEANLRSQMKELEDSNRTLENEKRQLEDRMKLLESQLTEHVAKLDDDTTELNDLKLFRKRLQEELALLQDRKLKEIEERDVMLEQTRKKYQKEIKQLISDLENEKTAAIRQKEVNNDLEQEVESVSNKYEAELRHMAVLKKEKEKLEIRVEDVLRVNAELSGRNDEHMNQISSLISQLRDAKSTLEDSEAQRNLLEKSKKTLESRLEEVSEQYSMADRSRSELTKSMMDLDQRAVDLREHLEELQDQINIANEKLRRAEQQLQDSATDLSGEKEVNLDLEKSKVLLEKQVKELNTRVFELEASLLTSSSGATRRLEARVNELMGQLDFEIVEKSELQKNVRKMERSMREIQFAASEKDKQKQRYEEDIEKLEQKIKKMKALLEELETAESNAQLAKRKAEREANDYKERSQRLEKEVEKYRKTVAY